MGWSEAQVIQAVGEVFPYRADLLSRGIGDDCAVLNTGCEIITTDASVEGVHFDLKWMTLADAAYRCMTSNLSDVAAMGAFPGPATVALGLRKDLDFADILSAIESFKTCIQDHGLSDCRIVGGDVVRSPNIFFSVTVLSQRPAWPLVLRSGAKPGDAILALGHPGMSAVGMEICRGGFHKSRPDAVEPFLHAFRRPKALVALGPDIARHRLATAMMDISDGVRTDLPRLLNQSGCGARIDLDKIAPTLEMQKIAAQFDLDPVDMMLCGGEDFGLLLTACLENVHKIQKLAYNYAVPCIELGVCTGSKGIEWYEKGRISVRSDLSFSHF